MPRRRAWATCSSARSRRMADRRPGAPRRAQATHAEATVRYVATPAESADPQDSGAPGAKGRRAVAQEARGRMGRDV